MSTSKSPTQLLRKQANDIASTLKRAERGEKIHGMFQAKIDAARKTDVFKVGVMWTWETSKVAQTIESVLK